MAIDLPASSLRFSRGLTVLELCAFVAVVAVLLGGMVSLARHVKSRGAEALTRERIESLSQRLRTVRDKPELAGWKMPRSMNEFDLRTWAMTSVARLMDVFARSDPSIRKEMFFDAWGTPIALVTQGGRQLGIPPDDNPFLVSAGPDRRFLSLGDNLYSYDLVAGAGTTNSEPTTQDRVPDEKARQVVIPE